MMVKGYQYYDISCVRGILIGNGYDCVKDTIDPVVGACRDGCWRFQYGRDYFKAISLTANQGLFEIGQFDRDALAYLGIKISTFDTCLKRI